MTASLLQLLIHQVILDGKQSEQCVSIWVSDLLYKHPEDDPEPLYRQCHSRNASFDTSIAVDIMVTQGKILALFARVDEGVISSAT